LIGKGSFGKVWKAIHKQTGSQVAIKLVRKKWLKKAGTINMELMKNELKALEDITHPHIPKVFELFEDHKHYCLVMELITGGNLAQKLKTEVRFSEEKT
jgi:calcium-dependent protein kinase